LIAIYYIITRCRQHYILSLWFPKTVIIFQIQQFKLIGGVDFREFVKQLMSRYVALKFIIYCLDIVLKVSKLFYDFGSNSFLLGLLN